MQVLVVCHDEDEVRLGGILHSAANDRRCTRRREQQCLTGPHFEIAIGANAREPLGNGYHDVLYSSSTSRPILRSSCPCLNSPLDSYLLRMSSPDPAFIARVQDLIACFERELQAS